MEIVKVENPFYSKDDNSSIDCAATFDNGHVYPYTATALDNMPYGQKLWNDLHAGVYGAISPYPQGLL